MLIVHATGNGKLCRNLRHLLAKVTFLLPWVVKLVRAYYHMTIGLPTSF